MALGSANTPRRTASHATLDPVQARSRASGQRVASLAVGAAMAG